MYVIKSTYADNLYLRDVHPGNGMTFWGTGLDDALVFKSIGNLLRNVNIIRDVDTHKMEDWHIVRVEQSGLKEVEVL